MSRKLFDAWFKNNKGDLALAARPNSPIITWAAAVVIGWLTNGKVESLAGAVGYGALFVWSWLELFQGVNYFRRSLGAVVLIYILFNAVKHGYFGS